MQSFRLQLKTTVRVEPVIRLLCILEKQKIDIQESDSRKFP